MPVFITVEPGKDLGECGKLPILDHFFRALTSEHSVGVIMSFHIVFDCSRHLLVCAQQGGLVKVLTCANTGLWPILIRGSSNFRLEKCLACLRVVQVVRKCLRIGHHHLRTLTAGIEATKDGRFGLMALHLQVLRFATIWLKCAI